MKKGFLHGERLEVIQPTFQKPLMNGKYTLEHFEVERLIGTGNYSEVLHVTEIATGKSFALKKIEKRKVERLRKTEEVLMEKQVLNKLANPGHKGIVNLHATFKDDTHLYFLMDYLPGGELWESLERIGCLEIPRARHYILQIIDALEYIHQRNIVHRDIKCENMMLDEKQNIVLIDFGSALDLDTPEKQGSGNGGGLGKKTFYHYVGTPNFMPPECIKNQYSGQAQDLFALGATIFQLLAGYPPFKEATEYLTLERVMALDYGFPEGFPELASNLCIQLMQRDPSDRISLSSVRAHPFLQGKVELPIYSLSELALCRLANVLYPQDIFSNESQMEAARSFLDNHKGNAEFSNSVFVDRCEKIHLYDVYRAIESNEHCDTIWNMLILFFEIYDEETCNDLTTIKSLINEKFLERWDIAPLSLEPIPPQLEKQDEDDVTRDKSENEGQGEKKAKAEGKKSQMEEIWEKYVNGSNQCQVNVFGSDFQRKKATWIWKSYQSGLIHRPKALVFPSQNDSSEDDE